jgi:predicted acyl esterase
MMQRRKPCRFARLLSWVLVCSAAAAATPYPGGAWEPGPPLYGAAVTEHVAVTMDDGVVLDAAIAYPADRVTGARAPGRFPVVLEHTPYLFSTVPPKGSGPANDYYATYGYISVRVNSRGTGISKGEHGFWSPREAKDGAALVDWAAHRLEGSDGRVAFIGCSFPGGYALSAAAAVGASSPLKAVVAGCVSLATTARHDTLVAGVPGGDLGFLYYAPERLMGAQPGTIAFYRKLGAEIRAGGDAAYIRDFWQQRLPMSYAQPIVDNGIPVLLWIGWQDHVGIGAFRTFTAFQNAMLHRPIYAAMTAEQPPSARYQMIVGNWAHGGGLDNGIILEWLETWLKGVDTGIQHTRMPLHLFEVGTGRWVNAARFPIVERSTLWFLGQGTLNSAARSGPGATSEVLRWGPASGSGNSLSYTSAPLADGATIAGPIAATIYASSSNRNLQLLARLYDVAADGATVEMTHGAVLGSLRGVDASKSWVDQGRALIWPWQPLDNDAYLRPGQVYRFNIWLEPRQWGVLPGHRLRLELTSQPPTSACPGPEKSAPGNEPCYLTAVQLQSVPRASYRIMYGPAFPSQLILPQLPAQALATAACRKTPTSGDACLPQEWGN